jgi:hypothetical protein
MGTRARSEGSKRLIDTSTKPAGAVSYAAPQRGAMRPIGLEGGAFALDPSDKDDELIEHIDSVFQRPANPTKPSTWHVGYQIFKDEHKLRKKAQCKEKMFENGYKLWLLGKDETLNDPVLTPWGRRGLHTKQGLASLANFALQDLNNLTDIHKALVHLWMKQSPDTPRECEIWYRYLVWPIVDRAMRDVVREEYATRKGAVKFESLIGSAAFTKRVQAKIVGYQREIDASKTRLPLQLHPHYNKFMRDSSLLRCSWAEWLEGSKGDPGPATGLKAFVQAAKGDPRDDEQFASFSSRAGRPLAAEDMPYRNPLAGNVRSTGATGKVTETERATQIATVAPKQQGDFMRACDKPKVVKTNIGNTDDPGAGGGSSSSSSSSPGQPVPAQQVDDYGGTTSVQTDQQTPVTPAGRVVDPKGKERAATQRRIFPDSTSTTAASPRTSSNPIVQSPEQDEIMNAVEGHASQQARTRKLPAPAAPAPAPAIKDVLDTTEDVRVTPLDEQMARADTSGTKQRRDDDHEAGGKRHRKEDAHMEVDKPEVEPTAEQQAMSDAAFEHAQRNFRAGRRGIEEGGEEREEEPIDGGMAVDTGLAVVVARAESYAEEVQRAPLIAMDEFTKPRQIEDQKHGRRTQIVTIDDVPHRARLNPTKGTLTLRLAGEQTDAEKLKEHDRNRSVFVEWANREITREAKLPRGEKDDSVPPPPSYTNYLTRFHKDLYDRESKRLQEQLRGLLPSNFKALAKGEVMTFEVKGGALVVWRPKKKTHRAVSNPTKTKKTAESIKAVALRQSLPPGIGRQQRKKIESEWRKEQALLTWRGNLPQITQGESAR